MNILNWIWSDAFLHFTKGEVIVSGSMLLAIIFFIIVFKLKIKDFF